MTMRRWLPIAISAVLPLVAEPTSAHERSLETVIEFDPALGELPESIAVDADGTFYVSMGASVVRVDAQLNVSTLATLPVPAGVFATGVKFGPDGFLYVASGAFDPTLEGAFVWRVSPITGATEEVAAFEPDGFPNDLAFDDEGTIYVTDSFLGTIWRVTPEGDVSAWLTDAALQPDPLDPGLPPGFGADGIAFDRNDRNLYVTNLDEGTILRIRVRRDGSPGPVQTFAADERLVGADGIAFDNAGTLYVAVNAQNRIATVDRRGRVRVIKEGGLLDGPSSLAFGVRRGQRRTLFISNFAISSASSGGPANPAILSLEVPRPGLPVP